MRIAWVSYDFYEYSSLHLNALATEHEVLAVMPNPQVDEEDLQLDPKVDRHLFDKPRLRQPFKQYRSIQSMLKAIYDFQPDVVHFQQAHLWFNFSLKKIQQDFPLVITIHDPEHHSGDLTSRKTPQWVVDHGFRQADHAIVHGDKLISQVCHRFGFSKQQVHSIPHVAMGNQAESSTESSKETDPNNILFFGRIWDYKGLKYLIEAEPLVSKEFPDVQFVIAGEGDDFTKYQRQMVNADRFTVYNEWISDQRRAELFRQSSFAVLPYTDATQSGVVPVAYNHKKPVVATDVGALSDAVVHSKTGLLIPPRDPESLAKAILQMLRNPEVTQQMGKRGYEWLRSECSPMVVAEKHVSAYRKAIDERIRNMEHEQVA